MASSLYTPSPIHNSITFVTNQVPNPHAQFIYHYNHFYFSPHPSMFVYYYPLWYVNPNPNQFVYTTQELPTLYSPNPSQEEPSLPHTVSRRFFGRRSGKKMIWRRKIKHEDESNEDNITTVMLRNIPNRYTREMMLEFMDQHCEEANKSEEDDEEFTISAYDVIYLPIDFKTEMNKGYAFVNFTNAKAVSKFKAACNYKPWRYFCSNKELEITSARIQGKEELVRHFEQITYPFEEFSAVCFSPARSGRKTTVQTMMVGKCT